MMFIVSSFVVFGIVWNSSMGLFASRNCYARAQSSYMGACSLRETATPVPPHYSMIQNSEYMNFWATRFQLQKFERR